MLGGSVIKVVSSCKINYFGRFPTILEDFDWTNTVGEVKGSFFSWSFLPWWPKSTKSHDLVFENSITGATGARFFLFMWIYPNQYQFEVIESVLKNEVCSWPCHHLKSIFGHLDERCIMVKIFLWPPETQRHGWLRERSSIQKKVYCGTP